MSKKGLKRFFYINISVTKRKEVKNMKRRIKITYPIFDDRNCLLGLFFRWYWVADDDEKK